MRLPEDMPLWPILLALALIAALLLAVGLFLGGPNPVFEETTTGPLIADLRRLAITR